jgi:hypothetical protein
VKLIRITRRRTTGKKKKKEREGLGIKKKVGE